MEIKIKTIPHKSQRYDTCGDWFNSKNGIEIRVSDMKNDDYEFCVGIHEAIEWYLCKKKGIAMKDVDDWDMWYEEARELKKAACGCKITKTSEAGNDIHAPYFNEHFFATIIEKLLAKQLKLNWKKYDKTICEL